jgi:hypothetical protein
VLDSCGNSWTGETPEASRGGSPPAPRKASILYYYFLL